MDKTLTDNITILRELFMQHRRRVQTNKAKKINNEFIEKIITESNIKLKDKLIEDIAENEELVNRISDLCQVFIYMSCFHEKHHFDKLYDSFFINLLTLLFKKIHPNEDEDILKKAVKKIFEVFSDQELINDYAISYIRKTIEIFQSNTNQISTRQIYGVIEGIDIQGKAGYSFLTKSCGLSEDEREKRDRIIKNKVKEITNRDYDTILKEDSDVETVSGRQEITKKGISEFLKYLLEVGIEYSILSYFSDKDDYVSQVISYAIMARSFYCLYSITMLGIRQRKAIAQYDDEIEQNIKFHSSLVRDFVSHEMLLILELRELEKLEKNNANKEKDKNKGKDKDKDISKEYIPNNVLNYSYQKPITGRAKNLHEQKKAFKKSANQNSVTTSSHSSTIITWNIIGNNRENKIYKYNSNKLISNIVRLTSDNSYLQDRAKNIYVHFNEQAIWKDLRGKKDTTAFRNYRSCFFNHTLVRSSQEDGFTFRESEKTGDVKIYLKDAHTAGMPDVRLKFTKTATAQDNQSQFYQYCGLKKGHKKR